MPAITALLHTHNDGLRLGRCLETLYPCDEILIVDHGSIDQTVRIAREYGAAILRATDGAPPNAYAKKANAEWILCLDVHESLTERLAASLFEWKSLGTADSAQPRPFSVFLREETPNGWVENPEAQTRLIPRNWPHWKGNWPSAQVPAVALDGEILRFSFP